MGFKLRQSCALIVGLPVYSGMDVSAPPYVIFEARVTLVNVYLAVADNTYLVVVPVDAVVAVQNTEIVILGGLIIIEPLAIHKLEDREHLRVMVAAVGSTGAVVADPHISVAAALLDGDIVAVREEVEVHAVGRDLKLGAYLRPRTPSYGVHAAGVNLGEVYVIVVLGEIEPLLHTGELASAAGRENYLVTELSSGAAVLGAGIENLEGDFAESSDLVIPADAKVIVAALHSGENERER